MLKILSTFIANFSRFRINSAKKKESISDNFSCMDIYFTFMQVKAYKTYLWGVTWPLSSIVPTNGTRLMKISFCSSSFRLNKRSTGTRLFFCSFDKSSGSATNVSSKAVTINVKKQSNTSTKFNTFCD